MQMHPHTNGFTRSILCVLAAIGLTAGPSALAATVPYSDGFETNSLGEDLSGVGGWVVSTNDVPGVSGRATVTNAPQTAAEGSNYASLTNATLSQAFTGNLSNVWSTAYVQLVFTESPASFPANATAVYFVGTNGLIQAYDGGARTTLTHTAIETGTWARISVELDYVNDTYDLWLDNTKLADNLDFYTNLVDDLSAVGVNSEGVGGLTLVDGVTANIGAPVPPEIRFMTTALTVLEGSTVTGKVVISFDAASDASININPTGGTATAGSDYTLTETTVTVPGAGTVLTQQFTFVVTDDTEDENDNETIVIRLEDPLNCSVAIADDVMIVTIDDTNDVYGLPFSETFESRTQGSLNGQARWESTTTTVITNFQVNASDSVYAGAQSGHTTNSGQASIFFTDQQTNVWAEVYVRPALGAAPSFPDTATAVYYFNAGGQIVAYNGTSAQTLSHTPASSNAFSRLTVNLDYVADTWDLYLEGVQLVTNYNFYSNSVSGFTRFGFHSTNDINVAGFWDNVSISIANLLGGGFQITNEATASGDVVLYVSDGDSTRTYHIIAVNNDARLTKSTVYTTANPADGAFIYTDSGIVNNAGVTSRYYQVVEVGTETSTNPTVWVMQKQARGSNTWHMRSVPVHFGDTNENTLAGKLGDQLADALVPQANQSIAPNVWAWDYGSASWSNFWLFTDGTWYTTASDPATFEIKPGHGIWMKTQTTDPGTSHTVFTGMAHSNMVDGITLSSNRWILFAWPFPEIQAESEGSVGNQGWSFSAQGAKGGTSWADGDRMFMESDGGFYNLYLGTDGRWYVQNTTTLAPVSLEHGKSYYYYGQGTSFVWRAAQAN